MATAYKGLRAGLPGPISQSAGQAITVVAEYDAATALIINDTIELLTKPAQHRMVDVTLITEDLDTGTAIVLDVGYKGGDLDAFIAASTVGQAGGIQAMNSSAGVLLAASVGEAEQVLQALVKTAPTGGGTGKIIVIAKYLPAQTLT